MDWTLSGIRGGLPEARESYGIHICKQGRRRMVVCECLNLTRNQLDCILFVGIKALDEL